jgi:hypothetical protein
VLKIEMVQYAIVTGRRRGRSVDTTYTAFGLLRIKEY